MRSNPRATGLWKRFAQSYGLKFLEAFGNEPNEEWINAIDDLTDKQLEFGYSLVRKLEPVFPPTLGAFQKACLDMPIAQQQKGAPSIQEQICEYAKIRLGSKVHAGMFAYSRQWTYVYREWFDASRPRGMERCSECIGVVIDLDADSRLGYSVADMLADTEGHHRVMRAFRPGPAPTNPQRDILDQVPL